MGHTPTPWRIDEGDLGIIRGPGGMIADVRGQEGHYFCPKRDQRERIDNAEFIIRACNCHDDLLAACKKLIEIWHRAGPLGSYQMEKFDIPVRMAEMAIDKAEGREP